MIGFLGFREVDLSILKKGQAIITNLPTTVTLMQFYKQYHELNANIAFFPLLDNVFNNGKSNISFLEATYAGSAFMGNRNLPEFNLPLTPPIQNGFKDEFMNVKDDFYRLETLDK